jgi:hypothetical protein
MTRQGGLPAKVRLGLLTKAPKPEGYGHQEVDAPGYARQPFELEGGGGAHTLGNRDEIVFGPVTEAWPKATHAAIFDDDGQLLCYGSIRSFPSGRRQSERVEFPAHWVRVRFPAQ